MAIISNSDHISEASNAVLALENNIAQGKELIIQSKDIVTLINNALSNMKYETKKSSEIIDSKIQEILNVNNTIDKNMQHQLKRVDSLIKKLHSGFFFFGFKTIALVFVLALSFWGYSLLENKKIKELEEELANTQKLLDDFRSFIIYTYGNDKKAKNAYSMWKEKNTNR
ncbi:hypothetical protein [Campylobacter suis]|uniref:Uncharacterized protein n=1 Tax=Campylobacter suis TaxID=2790657 RepID=A0ABM8Q252_9BACT|nr:hypothetical protein [Campylobacter suis]CAD7286881.1 hypothetical protein LMG8286_00587 [Campylobacter suis]